MHKQQKHEGEAAPLFCFLCLRLRVGVEDGQSDVAIPVIVVVSSGMTIAQLKDKVLVGAIYFDICISFYCKVILIIHCLLPSH